MLCDLYSWMHYPKSHPWIMFLISTRKLVYYLNIYGIIVTPYLCGQLDQLISTNCKSSSFKLDLQDLKGNMARRTGDLDFLREPRSGFRSRFGNFLSKYQEPRSGSGDVLVGNVGSTER